MEELSLIQKALVKSNRKKTRAKLQERNGQIGSIRPAHLFAKQYIGLIDLIQKEAVCEALIRNTTINQSIHFVWTAAGRIGAENLCEVCSPCGLILTRGVTSRQLWRHAQDWSLPGSLLAGCELCSPKGIGRWETSQELLSFEKWRKRKLTIKQMRKQREDWYKIS